MLHRRTLLALAAVAQAGLLAAGLVTVATWPEERARLVQDGRAAAPEVPVGALPSVTASAVPSGSPAASASAAAPAPPPSAQPVPSGSRPASPSPSPSPSPSSAPAPRVPAPAPSSSSPAPVAAADPAPAAGSSSPPATAAPPRPAASPGTAVVAAADYEDRLVAAVDDERTSRGLPALVRDGCADRFARQQADRMATSGQLSHQDLDPVLDACGGVRAAENVGEGDVTPEQLVALWMGSEAHRRTVLDPAMTSLGSGAVLRRADGRWYAAHVFLGR